MALTDEENMYNLSLGYIGDTEVVEGETTTKQYLSCSKYYAQARDEVLVSHLWNEAMKSVIIVQNAVNPIFGYDRRYSKPSDTLRIVSVDDDLGSDRRLNFQGIDAWEVKGDYISANAGITPPTWATDVDYIDGQFVTKDSVTYEVLVTHTSDDFDTDVTDENLESKGGDYRIVYVEYIWQLTDIDKFGPKLKQAIAIKLAIKIITGLTNDTKGKVDLINEFEKLTMPKARSIDAAEGTPKPIFSSEWLRARRG